MSGFLYLAIVVGWAVYLVPFALRRYDEANRARSVDRFSSAMRVLGRKEAAASVVGAAPQVAPAAVGDRREAARLAARLAARRRRRVLVVLLLTTAVVGVLSASVAWPTSAALAMESAFPALPALPAWSVAVPAGLTLGWLVLCRVGVRRERAGDTDVAETPVAFARLARDDARWPQGEGDDEPTVELDLAELAAVGVAAGTSADARRDGSLWDPVPVTLPTYVSKPRAARTIRTIDLGAPGTWTSGRTEESAALVEEAEQARLDQTGPAHGDPGADPEDDSAAAADAPAPRRAVGE